MIKLSIVILAFLALTSCSEPSPKLDSKNHIDTVATITNVADIIEDSTKVLVSDLPVRFDDVNVLIYAVRLVNTPASSGYSRSGSTSYSNTDFSSGYYDQNYLSGKFINLIFEDSAGKRKPLTDNKMTITQTIFLTGIFDITKKGYLLYTIYDRDTNGDEKFDSRDLQSLYISKVDGTEFRKVTSELHEYHDYRTHKDSNTLYFRTLEDINRDGIINNQDSFHYYTMTFNTLGYVINEYNPLDAFEK